ncbi:hypothetical protein AMTRI_Chr01g107430 [Amborella trichopoda]
MVRWCALLGHLTGPRAPLLSIVRVVMRRALTRTRLPPTQDVCVMPRALATPCVDAYLGAHHPRHTLHRGVLRAVPSHLASYSDALGRRAQTVLWARTGSAGA